MLHQLLLLFLLSLLNQESAAWNPVRQHHCPSNARRRIIFSSFSSREYPYHQQPPPSQEDQQLIVSETNLEQEEPSTSSDLIPLSSREICFGGVGRLYAAALDEDNDVHQSDPALSSSSSSSGLILNRLQAATVAVIGVGGVGSWAAEALCRSGLGNLVLVDLDDVCRSNTNRQLHAMSSTVGRMKIDVLHDRLVDISPNCNVTLIHDFVTGENVEEIVTTLSQVAPFPDKLVVLDAVDGATEKAALVSACVARGIPTVVCGGAAGRTDPTQIAVHDLTRVSGDKLLLAVRRNLRKYHGFPAGAPFGAKKKPKQWKITSVYSTQEPRQQEQSTNSATSSTSSLRRCDSSLGTACFVTGTFGFVAAGCIVDKIANDSLQKPLT